MRPTAKPAEQPTKQPDTDDYKRPNKNSGDKGSGHSGGLDGNRYAFVRNCPNAVTIICHFFNPFLLLTNGLLILILDERNKLNVYSSKNYTKIKRVSMQGGWGSGLNVITSNHIECKVFLLATVLFWNNLVVSIFDVTDRSQTMNTR